MCSCVHFYIQWNLCIMDTLGTAKCPDYQGVLIFQVISYDKVSFGTSTKCVDYAGVHINRFHCIPVHTFTCRGDSANV